MSHYLHPDKKPATMTGESFVRRTIPPDDIIDGVKHLLLYDIRGEHTCVPGWVAATKYLEWAETALVRDSPEGYASAMAHAKRAVCRNIDGLLLNRHLRSAINKRYPDKLEILTSIGVRAPGIVHSYIIEPRNTEEHDYSPPDKSRAKVAVEMAQLFVAATKDAVSEGCLILLGENLEPLLPVFPPLGPEEVVCGGLPEEPFVFVDVFEEPPNIKIIFAKDREILACELSRFSVAQSVELTGLLTPGSLPLLGGATMTKGPSLSYEGYLRRIKEQARI
jgi:hypothetical protein